ncbi:hypothetical protein G6011_07877 [Alternaria panax]|uniref:Uncharacterized protein n=1 Tax=Alternaria panax TaxID=48097 RepID=A0AAD4F8K1_9PLEO|nr:hypothetical protein G6011_07877 [Alternaria panax]
MSRPRNAYTFDMLPHSSVSQESGLGTLHTWLMFGFEIDVVGRAWNFVLFMRSLRAIGINAIDSVRTNRVARRQAEVAQELKELLRELSREKLRNIAESRLDGIQALPVELWSQIIEHVMDPCLQYRKRQCRDMLKVLKLRIVCRAFDKEIRRALHQRLSLYQLPYYPFLAYRMPTLETSLCNALLASALYNETQRCSGNNVVHPIAYRIKNCVLVAQHLSSDHNIQHEQHMYKIFCAAASTSHSCMRYISGLRYSRTASVSGVDNPGGSKREGDVLLEVSLLVANGYQLEDAKRWMRRLGRLGMLVGYRGYFVQLPNGQQYLLDQVDAQYEWVNEECFRCGRVHRVEEQLEEAGRMARDELERELDEELEDMERHVLYMSSSWRLWGSGALGKPSGRLVGAGPQQL